MQSSKPKNLRLKTKINIIINPKKNDEIEIQFKKNYKKEKKPTV